MKQKLDNEFCDYPLEETMSFRINRLSTALSRQASNLLAKESNINLVEWRLLRLLEHDPNSTGRDLNRISGMDTAQISRGIRRLEERNLISTRRDKNDGRNLCMKLTLQGHQLYEQTIPVINRRNQGLYSNLDEEEYALFSSILDKLENYAQVLDFPDPHKMEQ